LSGRMQPEYHQESGVAAEKSRKGLNTFSAVLVGVIACIFVICVLAIVLGLIPVYINAAQNEQTATTTTTATTATTATTTLSPINASGSTNVQAEATVLSLIVPSTARFSARVPVTCGTASVDVGDLTDTLTVIMNSQATKVCNQSTISNVSCSPEAGGNKITFTSNVTLKSDTLYCSIQDVSNTYQLSAEQFEEHAKALFPSGIYQLFKSLTSILHYNGKSVKLENGIYTEFVFDECQYLNGAPTILSCTNSTSSTLPDTTAETDTSMETATETESSTEDSTTVEESTTAATG